MAEGVSLMRLALKVPHQDLDKQNHITPFGMLFAAIHSVVPCISQGKPSSALESCQAVGQQHHWFVAWCDLCWCLAVLLVCNRLSLALYAIFVCCNLLNT